MGPIIKRLATAKTTAVTAAAASVTDTYDFTLNGRQKVRLYYRCSSNPVGTPNVALTLLPLIPDLSTTANLSATPTFDEGKETVAWPLSTGNDETYVYPATGSIGAAGSAADYKLMVMLETPVGELRAAVTVSGSANHSLTYDLIAELV